MVIRGAQGLAQLINGVVVPALPVVFQLLKQISAQRAELDQQAASALQDVALKTAAISPEHASQVATWYVQVTEVMDRRASVALTATLLELSQLPVDSQLRNALMYQAQQIDGTIRVIDRKTVGDIATIGAAGAAAVAVIAAVGSAFKNARKPTAMESIFGKK